MECVEQRQRAVALLPWTIEPDDAKNPEQQELAASMTAILEQARLPHAPRPDRDNLDKACLDALKGLLWIDHAHICDVRMEKWIAAGAEQPHVLIRVTAINDRS